MSEEQVAEVLDVATEHAPPIEETQKKKEPATKMLIAVKDGDLAPMTHVELMSMIAKEARGNTFPDCFDTIDKQFAAYSLAHSLMQSDWRLAVNNMAYIKGKLTIFGELPGTLAQRTGELDRKILFIIDREYNKICFDNKNLDAKVWAAICQIKRTGGELVEFFYTLDEAEKAGQYPPKRRDGSINSDSPWEKNFKTMLLRKAQGAAIKFMFPEAMVGVKIAEYDFDEAPDLVRLKDVTPGHNSKAELLNANFSNKEAQQ